MRPTRAIIVAFLLVLVAPAAVAEAATLTEARARAGALREAVITADQEETGRDAAVESCSRRGARRFICRVSWRYTAKGTAREVTTCEENICTLDTEFEYEAEERTCRARVDARYNSPRRRRLSVALSGQRCTPFFRRIGDGAEN